MRVREWASIDYYAELGVPPTATRDEIAAAFRARARRLHPDAGPSDPAAIEAFRRVATAYRVLSGPLRTEYDRARRQVLLSAPGAAVGSAARQEPTRAGTSQLTRRGARWALGGGLALVVAGLGAAALVVSLQVRDAHLRAEGVPVTAAVVREGGRPRLEFTTRTGTVVRADLPDEKSGALRAGDTAEVRYDPDNPRRVVTAASTVARDITLWIVAVKLVVVGVVLAAVGARRLRRPAARSGRPRRAAGAAGTTGDARSTLRA